MSSVLFSFFSEPASSPSFPSRFVARVQPVNEITRSNLWHQIPNENMIIAANAEYRVRRTAVPRDRRRRTSGDDDFVLCVSNCSFRTTQNRPYYRTKSSATQTRSRFSKPSSLKVVCRMLQKIPFCRIIDLN